MPQLTATQSTIVNELVALFNSAPGVDIWFPAFMVFMEDEVNFTFEECEAICMEYGWA